VEIMDKTLPSQMPVKAPMSWQEQFVQSHASGNPQAPVYENFWTDVDKVSNDLLKTSSKTGSITRAQLAQGMDNSTFRGDQAQVAGALYDTFSQLKPNSAATKFSPTGDQINGQDLAAVIGRIKNGEAQFHDVDGLTYWADNQKNLQRFSSNGSGSVTYSDLTQALKKTDLAPQDREKLQELESKFHAIAPSGKLGKQEIDAYYDGFTATNSDFRLGKQFLHDMRHVSDAQNDANSRKLFANEKNPIESIKVDGVTQGFAGDCSFKASLAAVVAAKPDAVLNMLKQQGDNDLQVNFPGMKGKAIGIKSPSAEEIGLYSMQATQGNWASALEKAYGEKVYQQADSTQKKIMASEVDADRAANDGFTRDALQTLTGHSVDVNDVSQMSTSQIRSTLESAQKAHQALVLNTAAGDPVTKTAGGFAIDHAFTVLGVNSQGEVTVRDPRAYGQNRPDGIMQISLDQLKGNFKTLFVESNHPIG
jgi:hypothetical protein